MEIIIKGTLKKDLPTLAGMQGLRLDVWKMLSEKEQRAFHEKVEQIVRKKLELRPEDIVTFEIKE